MSIVDSASLPPSHHSDFRRVWGQNFGRFIQQARETQGRSIEEAARLAGVETSEWEALEAGYVPIDSGRLRSIADALEMNWDRMVTLALFCREAWNN